MLLAETFVGLIERENPDKVFVSDIISAAGKNRKTFYYHFTDKDQLIRWLFRHDLGTSLVQSFAPAHLVYESQSDDPSSEFPYYVFVKSGVRSLDGSDFMRELAHAFELRRPYYRRLLRSSSGDALIGYLTELYSRALASDVLFVLSNRQLPQENIRFLAEFYAGALVSYLVRQIRSTSTDPLLKAIGPFSNIIHTSLENEIKEQQLRRRL